MTTTFAYQYLLTCGPLQAHVENGIDLDALIMRLVGEMGRKLEDIEIQVIPQYTPEEKQQMLIDLAGDPREAAMDGAF